MVQRLIRDLPSIHRMCEENNQPVKAETYQAGYWQREDPCPYDVMYDAPFDGAKAFGGTDSHDSR